MIQKKHQIETFRGSLLKTLVIGTVTTFFTFSNSFSPDNQVLASASRDNTVKGQENAVVTSNLNDKSLISTIVSAITSTKVNIFNRLYEYEHQGIVSSVDFSPDGKTIASASWDKTIRIWNVNNGKEIRISGHSSSVSSVSFSPDGKTIASASWDKTIRIWNVNNGKEIRTLKGHSGSVSSVSFSPDGQAIATASSDKTVKLWTRDGTLIGTLKGHEGYVNSVVFSPNGKILVSASSDKTIKLWDLTTDKQLKTLSGHNAAVRSVSFSPDGKTFASASDDGTVKLWSQDGRELKTLRGDSGRINSVVFSRDGKTIITGSDDGTVRIWNQNSLLLRTLRACGRVHSLDISPDGKSIITGCDNGTIYLFNTNNGTLIRSVKGHDNKVSRLNYIFNGRFIISASDDGTVKLWNSDLSIQKNDLTTALFTLVIGLGSSAAIFFVVRKRLQKGKHTNTTNTHSSFIITGWIVCVLPEDWLGNLEALRYELISANKNKWYIRFITVTTIIDMFYGGIRIKLENFYDGEFWMVVTGRQSITENKDTSSNHNDSNE